MHKYNPAHQHQQKSSVNTSPFTSNGQHAPFPGTSVNAEHTMPAQNIDSFVNNDKLVDLIHVLNSNSLNNQDNTAYSNLISSLLSLVTSLYLPMLQQVSLPQQQQNANTDAHLPKTATTSPNISLQLPVLDHNHSANTKKIACSCELTFSSHEALNFHLTQTKHKPKHLGIQ